MRLFNRNAGPYPAGAQYIGRGSYYGNPFRVGVDGDRDECLDRYEREVLPSLDVEPLRGRDLVCFCTPKRCHGEAILTKLYGNAWRLV